MDKEADVQMEEFPTTRMLTMLDMPYDVMDNIIYNMDLVQQIQLRNSFLELREHHTRHTLHYYQCYLHNCERNEKLAESPEERTERIMLQVLDTAVKYYLREGFESQFACNLLGLKYQKSLGSKMTPSVLFRFLFRFQHCLDSLHRDKVQDLRLIYTVTLLSLLRKFPNFRIIQSSMHLMHWQVVVELPNVFVGVLEERRIAPSISNQKKLFGFLSILTELFYYVKMNQSFGGFKDTSTVAYSYGFQCDTLLKREPRLVIKCMVLAPKSVLRLLKDVVTGKDVPESPIQVPPGGTFRARLQVNSKPAKRFFDYGTMHINICQHDELSE